MKRIPYFLATAFLFFVQTVGFSQQQSDLRNEQTFFEKQKDNYKDWLIESGLDKALTIRQLNVNEANITLKLDFNFSASDSSIWAWKRLKNDFESKSSMNLENTLFSRLAFMTELEFKKVNINIKNKYKPGDLPSVDINIYFDTLEQEIVAKGFFRSIVKDSVAIPHFSLKRRFNQKDTSISIFGANPNKYMEYVENLKQKFKSHFKGKTDTNNIQLLSREPCIFQVLNIKSIAVPSGIFTIIDPTEMLTFTINLKRENQSVRVYCTIDGKYGSGLFRPRSLNGYRDMFPEYKNDLIRYSQIFTQNTLYQWINEIINHK